MNGRRHLIVDVSGVQIVFEGSYTECAVEIEPLAQQNQPQVFALMAPVQLVRVIRTDSAQLDREDTSPHLIPIAAPLIRKQHGGRR